MNNNLLKINSESIKVWPKFDSNNFIDFNPCHITLDNGKTFVFFRRESIPLFQNFGSIWVVEVNINFEPINDPIKIIEVGEDPRAVVRGNEIFLFYVVPINANGRTIGSHVNMAELIYLDEFFITNGIYKLPINPFGNVLTEGGINGWEKNWIPYINKLGNIKIIYSHDPWLCFELKRSEESVYNLSAPKNGVGLKWRFGKIRGGTPPVSLNDGKFISFFHSSTVFAGKKIYLIGAVILEYNDDYLVPISFTDIPLLCSNYFDDISNYGWKSSASVLFPQSAIAHANYVDLFLGINDYDIGIARIDLNNISKSLVNIPKIHTSILFDIYNENQLKIYNSPILEVPFPIGGVAESSIIKLISLLFGGGKKFIDIGAHIGFYSILLSNDFEELYAFEPSTFQFEWLEKNICRNGLSNINRFKIGIGDSIDDKNIHVLSGDGGLNTFDMRIATTNVSLDVYKCPIRPLDFFNIKDIDLIKIDVEGLEEAVLNGALDSIKNYRPIILIEVWEDSARRDTISNILVDLNYSFEFIFPVAPELAICFPHEKREDYSWFFGK
jgi:FkbM family methyltransferase